MKDLVTYIVKSLVDNPDEVSVSETEERGETVLELSVAGSDMGRIIGRKGRVINAVRSLLQVAAAKQGSRVALELLETGDR